MAETISPKSLTRVTYPTKPYIGIDYGGQSFDLGICMNMPDVPPPGCTMSQLSTDYTGNMWWSQYELAKAMDAAIRNKVLYDIPKIYLNKEEYEKIEKTMARVKRRAEISCGIPARHCGVMARNEVISEQSLSELLEEIEGKKEDNMDSLMDRKIKKVVIECEDGSTYEGSITRMEGNPYNLRSTLVEAKIVNRIVGNYGIKEVVFNNPTTKVVWVDGTETVVICQDNVEIIEKVVDGKTRKRRKFNPSGNYSKEIGLAMCIVKKWYGNNGSFNNIFKKFIEGYTEGKK